MAEVDVRQIVPSTRDLFQVVSTRKQNLAIIAELSSEGASAEAARLADLGVSAFALGAPADAMIDAARSTKTVPMLALDAVRDRAGCQASRYHGADGICVDGALDTDAWDDVAKAGRSMRMAAFGLAENEADLERAMAAGARAIVLRAPTADAIRALAAKAQKRLTLIADIATSESGARKGAADASAIRSLVGVFDAAIVPPALHKDASFAALIGEVDP